MIFIIFRQEKKYFKTPFLLPGMVVYASNLEHLEVGETGIQDQPWTQKANLGYNDTTGAHVTTCFDPSTLEAKSR